MWTKAVWLGSNVDDESAVAQWLSAKTQAAAHGLLSSKLGQRQLIHGSARSKLSSAEGVGKVINFLDQVRKGSYSRNLDRAAKEEFVLNTAEEMGADLNTVKGVQSLLSKIANRTTTVTPPLADYM